MNTPRKPLVPAVPGPSAGPGIAARAIATREAQREARSQPPSTIEPVAPPRRQQELPITSIGNVAGAVAEVMANVGTIKKGGWNNFHRYHYARMEDLLEVVTPLMGKNGLTVWQNEVEIKMVETRVAVTYEFIVMHKSGERMPAQRFTGVCMARDSKGNFDDKSILKCNTQARKYFLLSLFQVPSGDFEEADQGPAQPQQQSRAVPGPSSSPPPPQEEKQEGWRPPQKIALGAGAGADQWARAFINAISHAKTADEVRQWDALNDQTLQTLSDKYPAIYDQIDVSSTQMLDTLGAGVQQAPTQEAEDTMPADTQEAMNWIATKLQSFTDYESGEKFWNEVVAPKEGDFDRVDWDMLVQEWQRFETKFPQSDPPEAA